MKQVQVNVLQDSEDEVKEVIDNYSSDVFSSEGKRDGKEITMFTATVKSSDIDEMVSELKSIKEIESGQLVIRLLDEQTLIEKGQKTRGGSSMLSQEEVYSKAQESAVFNNPQWILMAFSAAIASYGLILDNVALVIGAMMLAPILSPLVSGAISLTIGDKKLLQDAAKTSFFGVLIAVSVAAISVLPFEPTVTPIMELVVSAEVPNMILSVFVGSAAVLAFSTGARDQIAGVAVAIALVPPLAAVGVGLRMTDWVFVSEAASIALLNLFAVIVSGSTSLKLMGFKPSTYYKQKTAEKLRAIYPVSTVIMAAIILFLIFKPV